VRYFRPHPHLWWDNIKSTLGQLLAKPLRNGVEFSLAAHNAIIDKRLPTYVIASEAKPSAPIFGLRKYVEPVIPDAQQFVEKLADFVHVEARLPSIEKNYIRTVPIEITVEQSRKQIIDYLRQLRGSNSTADLAFYAYRDIESCDWAPFIKAAVERNPVSVQMVDSMFGRRYICVARTDEKRLNL